MSTPPPPADDHSRCQRCSAPMTRTAQLSFDNGLTVTLSGGYGEFHDDFPDGPHQLVLCHDCAHQLTDWLRVDVHNWHTHNPHSGWHPDHHDGAVSAGPAPG